MALRRAGHQLVLTHGNGPQVGLLALAMPEQPLDALTAMTQGQIGYLLETAIGSVDPGVPTATLLTRVVVDPDDPAFATPTKPVGPFYDAARRRAGSRSSTAGRWPTTPAAAGGAWWRARGPLEVLGAANVRTLLDAGVLVIAGGGGGVPVDAGRAGLPGVVDKDRCSAELALAIGADLLILLTGVPRVAIDYGTRWERELERITRLGRRARAGRGRVPGRQHGPEDRVGAAVRRGRRPRRDHHAGASARRGRRRRTARGSCPTRRRSRREGARRARTATSTACG